MKEAMRVRKSGVYHSELSSQECVYSLALADKEKGCSLREAGDRVNSKQC